jgi:hypothetical protein
MDIATNLRCAIAEPIATTVPRPGMSALNPLGRFCTFDCGRGLFGKRDAKTQEQRHSDLTRRWHRPLCGVEERRREGVREGGVFTIEVAEEDRKN